MLPLKEATATKHKLAERMPFNTRMFRGLITKEEYRLYLLQQWHVFATIERVGLPHEDLPREGKVKADLEELGLQGNPVEQVLKSTHAYAGYLASLSYQQLLPHVYLNYLALVYGGQMMKKSVPSSGRMYDFDNMQEAVQSIRAVQSDDWADEVNKGFDYIIEMFDELEKVCVARGLAKPIA